MVPTLPLNQYFTNCFYRRLRDGDSLVIVPVYNVAYALARHCQFTSIFMLQKQICQISPTGIRTTNHSYDDWAHNLLHQNWITTIGEVWLHTYIHGSNTSKFESDSMLFTKFSQLGSNELTIRSKSLNRQILLAGKKFVQVDEFFKPFIPRFQKVHPISTRSMADENNETSISAKTFGPHHANISTN